MKFFVRAGDTTALVFCILFIPTASVKAHTEEFVAKCNPDKDKRYIIANLSPLSQSFIATTDTISDIAVYLWDAGTVKFELIKPPTFSVVATGNMINSTSIAQFVHYRFPSGLAVEKGDWYWIRLSAPMGVATTWIYTNDQECYHGGQALYGWNPYNFINSDFGFLVYGYNKDGSTPSPSPSGKTDDKSGTAATKNNTGANNDQKSNQLNTRKAIDQNNSASQTQESDISSPNDKARTYLIIGLSIVLLILIAFLYKTVKSRKKTTNKAKGMAKGQINQPGK